MSARVVVLCGPARSGKTERLLARYRAAKKGMRPIFRNGPTNLQSAPGAAHQLVLSPFSRVLWLAPTWRAAAEVRERLFDGTFAGCFAPGVMTFEKFAEAVLHAAGVPLRPVTRLMKHELLRQIIGEQAARGRLKHFQPIAATGGLVDLVCEFIGELKRLEIWPEEFHRACAARGVSDKDVELFEIYDRYQQSLREHGLFDAEGRFWSARDVLARGQENAECGMTNDELPGAKSAVAGASILHHSSFITHHWQLVVVDGFADFTRTQYEIIEILAARAQQTVITLPLESEPRRADLFAKPRKTLTELRRRHGEALMVEELPRPPRPAWLAMARLESALFANPREQEKAVETEGSGVRFEGIEILAAARQAGEIELIAARIKRLLVDGLARPGDVAVVFRLPQEVGGLVSEVFGRLGIPVVFEAGQALDRAPALRALVALLQLDLDDWPFDQLLAVLGSNYFRPDESAWQEGGRAAADVERTIRQLQIPRGRARLIEQLRSSGRTGATAGRNERTGAVVGRLAAALDALPERTTLPEWAKAWRQLAQQTGLLRAIGDAKADDANSPFPLPSAPFLSDRLAWNRLTEVLAAGDTLAGWLARRPPELDRRGAFEALTDILRSERVGHGGDESGYVRVLSAASVRSLRISYLFLAGLSEKVFPPPDREDRLYGEAEYLRLIDAGLPLAARTERTRDEMLLFYEAITRATKRLYLSYPALDESAQPLLPSPFLTEVEHAFGGGKGDRSNLCEAPSGPFRQIGPVPFSGIPRVERTDLRPIPLDDEPLSNAEFRIKAVAMALEGNVALLAGLLSGDKGRESNLEPSSPGTSVEGSGLASNLTASLEMIHLRQDRQRFGPAEGVLQSPEAKSYMAARFPLSHTFAATELERYAACPFRFFLERVLKIEPVADLALEFDPMNRGRVVHDVLAVFHRRVNERLGRPGSPLRLDAAEFDALLAAAIAESLPPEPENPVQAALGEIDRRLVVEWLSQYRQQLTKYDALWADFDTPLAPELFEVSFGRDDQQPLSTAEPLEFAREGQVVRVSGRIDRIDVGVVAGKAVCNVLDYKTGGSIPLGPESIRAGTTLQLPLYALAATELLLPSRDVRPWQAGYWYVREGGFRPRQALKMYRRDDGRLELEAEWEDLRNGLSETVVMLVRAIRRGQFPVCSRDERCTGHCPYSTICRINQVRSLEKTCQPTAIE